MQYLFLVRVWVKRKKKCWMRHVKAYDKEMYESHNIIFNLSIFNFMHELYYKNKTIEHFNFLFGIKCKTITRKHFLPFDNKFASWPSCYFCLSYISIIVLLLWIKTMLISLFKDSMKILCYRICHQSNVAYRR